ncbi:glycosyltransferase [Saccharospirillum impatiens]|uniref:glycosyltransferase n=1 Tax=Saccharospirillum impatiens TaxID=169438 RepID=UPI00042961EF|nr:glycosyltransferase [Saccharospirillum impatiens]
MAHIVGVWELGGHLGHLGRFAALVPQFIERGHRVTLLLRDLARVQHMEGLKQAAIMQAPLWMPRSKSAPAHPVSMPEILQHYGYLSVPGLHGMVRAWSDTFEALQPDLLMCDLAPTALLAARDRSFVCTSIGSGYSIPPTNITPMPTFREVSPEVRSRSLVAEQKVSRVIEAVAEKMGQPAINHVSELFNVDEAFLCTLPELDHYDRPQPARYWGLPTQAKGGVLPNWSGSGRRRVFAYVKPPGAHFDATIQALQQSGCEAEVYAPGISREALKRYASDTLKISAKPYDLVKTFETCDAVICHAGHETVVAALVAGRPVVLIPLQMEQYAFARRVEAQGVGKIVAPDALSALPRALERVLDAPCRERARVFASRHKVESPTSVARKIAEHCEHLLAN